MPEGSHLHTIPVDPSQTADEAWRELCIFGQRVTYTDGPGRPVTWANVECDGDECRLLEPAAAG